MKEPLRRTLFVGITALPVCHLYQLHVCLSLFFTVFYLCLSVSVVRTCHLNFSVVSICSLVSFTSVWLFYQSFFYAKLLSLFVFVCLSICCVNNCCLCTLVQSYKISIIVVSFHFRKSFVLSFSRARFGSTQQNSLVLRTWT